MNALRKVAQRIRHHPRLEGAGWFWRPIRRSYHWALDPLGRGVGLKVGGHCPVRIPADLTGQRWEDYEPAEFGFLKRWLQQHPDGRVIDIGCSVGIFSAAVLFASRQVEVLAIDPDLASLAVTRRMTRYAPNRQLRLLHGFLSAAPSGTATLGASLRSTEAALRKHKDDSDAHAARFQSLLASTGSDIPVYRIDDLLAEVQPDRPMLIKCDVEGAELNVLMGASDALKRLRPDILLSVHVFKDFGLPQYGHSKADVEAFLHDHGYTIDCIGIDHEEHWACLPRPAAAEDQVGLRVRAE